MRTIMIASAILLVSVASAAAQSWQFSSGPYGTAPMAAYNTNPYAPPPRPGIEEPPYATAPWHGGPAYYETSPMPVFQSGGDISDRRCLVIAAGC